MEKKLCAAAVQFNIALGEVDQNLAKAGEALVRLAEQNVQLAVLPEMWSAGYDYKRLAKHADETPRVLDAIKEVSAKHKMIIVGSLPEKVDGKIYNTAFVIDNKCIQNKTVAIGVRNESKSQIIGNKLSRTGGMPPMIAIQEESRALIADNTISGGGVAGVLVRGTATITGNQFEGNGPRKGPGPPNFAAWVQEGSTVTFSDNRVDRWRHALSASDAESVRAIGNITSQFIDTAIVVHNSAQPAHVSGNVAVSENEQDESVRVTGPQGAVSDNVRRALRPSRVEPVTEPTREN